MEIQNILTNFITKRNNIFITFTNDANFWSDIGKDNTIYYKFRKLKTLNGQIVKPTGAKDKVIELNGEYKIEWQLINKIQL